MLAADYAKALRAAGGSAQHLKNLRDALARRGHEKLLPQIFAEYRKLELHDKRLAAHKKMTPHAERTRTLLELYRTLIHSNG